MSTVRWRRADRCRATAPRPAGCWSRGSLQVEAARLRLATGRPTRLSELGALDPHCFGHFLNLLGEALAEQEGPGATVERQTGWPLAHSP